jgi:hypothetical protein
MDRDCPFCGDVMTCWACGPDALQLCFGAGASDFRTVSPEAPAPPS